MYGQKETLYDVLGLLRSATTEAVERAYQRERAEMQKDSAPVDPRRVALVHEAYEVLRDPQRRAAYDASLRSRRFLGIEAKMEPRTKWAAIAAGAALAAGILYLVLRSPSGPGESDPREILAKASYAVGRLQSLDISGRAVNSGLVFATGEGALISTCHGIRAGSQLVAKIEPRTIPVHVVLADDVLDICKLTGDDVGNLPLRLSGNEARPGDKVYLPRSDAAGKLELDEGTVKEISNTSDGRILVLTIPIAAETSGAPLLDRFGRVVGIAKAPHAYGDGRNVALPVSWIAEARSRTLSRSPPRK